MDEITEKTKVLCMKIFPSLIIIFGLIGNLTSFVVYSTKELNKISVSIYFRLLAITDSFNLLIYLPLLIKFTFEHEIHFLTDLLCRVFTYFSYSMPSMSSFILIILSLDRAVCVIYPNNKLFRRKKSQLISILVIIVFNLSVYILIWFSYVKLEESNYTVCACKYKVLCTIIRWIDVFNSFILPFLIMFTCSLIVIFQIRKSKHRIETHQLGRTQSNCIKNSNAFLHSRNVQFACTSFVLNIIFLACNLPITIYQLGHFENYDNGMLNNGWFYPIAELIYYFHFGLSFLVHVLFNIKFRSELNRLIVSKLFKRNRNTKEKTNKNLNNNNNINDTLNNSKLNSNSHF